MKLIKNDCLQMDELTKEGVNFEKYTISGKEDFQNFTRDAKINKKRGLSEDTITDNLLIKGNNLLVLHSLVEEFRGKVKCIYIDPPYNTGNDSFNYNDKFNHSSWLCFMKNRLEIARELLREDGVIFIQCDDNEQAYLKVLMDEIFRKENFIACCPRKTTEIVRKSVDNELQKLNDYVLVYSKMKNLLIFNKRITGQKEYHFNDKNGRYYLVSLQNTGEAGTREARPNLYYPVYYNNDNTLTLEKNENTIKEILPQKVKGKDGRWLWSKEKFLKDWKRLVVQDNKIFDKRYEFEIVDQNKYEVYKTWLDCFKNSKGTIALNECFEEKGIFNNPKPEELLEWVINLGSKEHDIILDFFSGSGTTGAVAHKMNRQWIMVEQMDYIETITKERMKKVIEGEQGGISKSVNWQGGGEFVYFELKKDFINKQL